MGLPDFRFTGIASAASTPRRRLKGCSSIVVTDKRNARERPGPRHPRGSEWLCGKPIRGTGAPIYVGTRKGKDNRPEARPGDREAPGRHERRGDGGGPHRHELLRVPERDHRQRDRTAGPQGVLRAPRRRAAAELLGDDAPPRRSELADLLLVPERGRHRPHPRGGRATGGNPVVQGAAGRGVGPFRSHGLSYSGHAAAPTSGTNAHGVPSRVRSVPSGPRVATTSTWPCRVAPTGATIRPPGASWAGHDSGMRGAPAVAMMHAYGARSG